MPAAPNPYTFRKTYDAPDGSSSYWSVPVSSSYRKYVTRFDRAAFAVLHARMPSPRYDGLDKPEGVKLPSRLSSS